MEANRGDSSHCQISSGQHAYIAETTAQARSEFAEYFVAYARMGVAEATRGATEAERNEPRRQRVQSIGDMPFEKLVKPALCYSAEEATDYINHLKDELTLNHYWAYFDLGGIDTPKLYRSMERFAAHVMPKVRD